MTRSVPTNQPTTEKPVYARDLAPGMHLAVPTNRRGGRDIMEVRYVLPYNDGDGTPQISVTATRVLTGTPAPLVYPAAEPVELATPEQVAEAGAVSRREVFAAELRRLADDIVRLRLPLPEYGVDFRGCLGDGAELERWAEYLNVSARVNGAADRIPSVDAELGRGPGWYGSLLDVHMQSRTEPEPVEMLTPAEWAERDGVVIRDADGWPDEESFQRPIWRLEWERRLAVCTVDLRTVAPVVPGVVAVDGAAMAEAVAVVNDQVAATPPDAVEYGQDDRCKCGFRAPELGPHPDCLVHREPEAGEQP